MGSCTPVPCNRTVAAEYENPRDKKTRLALRGDGKSFTGLARELKLERDSEGPVQSALRGGEETIVQFGEGTDASLFPSCASMKRADYAQEFNICEVHFVPFSDEKTGKKGVLEFGVSTINQCACRALLCSSATPLREHAPREPWRPVGLQSQSHARAMDRLNEVTLKATMQLQADSAGAGYAIYWKKEKGRAVVAGEYISKCYRAELEAEGKTISFAEASEALTFDIAGENVRRASSRALDLLHALRGPPRPRSAQTGVAY
jgi:hypothetical protein